MISGVLLALAVHMLGARYGLDLGGLWRSDTRDLMPGRRGDRVVADRHRRLFRRLFHRDADAQRRLWTAPATHAAIPDRGRRAAVGGRRSGRLRPEPRSDHLGRAGGLAALLPRRGDGFLRREFALRKA